MDIEMQIEEDEIGMWIVSAVYCLDDHRTPCSFHYIHGGGLIS